MSDLAVHLAELKKRGGYHAESRANLMLIAEYHYDDLITALEMYLAAAPAPQQGQSDTDRAQKIMRENGITGWTMDHFFAVAEEAIKSKMGAPVVEAEATWQPIETAPKDGTRIIAWCVHTNAKYAKDPVAEGWCGPVVTKWIDHNGGGWTWHGLAGTFTHWTTGPDLPSMKQDEKS